MSKSKAILAAAAVAATLATGAAGDAEAKGKRVHIVVGHKHGHFKHFHHRRAFIVASPVVYSGGCGFYKSRWLNTGLYHWKSKYYQCMGWW